MDVSMFDFEKPVQVINWVTGEVKQTVPGIIGLVLMAFSIRWDTQHCTANVRTIDGQTPITFRQEAAKQAA